MSFRCRAARSVLALTPVVVVAAACTGEFASEPYHAIDSLSCSAPTTSAPDRGAATTSAPTTTVPLDDQGPHRVNPLVAQLRPRLDADAILEFSYIQRRDPDLMDTDDVVPLRAEVIDVVLTEQATETAAWANQMTGKTIEVSTRLPVVDSIAGLCQARHTNRSRGESWETRLIGFANRTPGSNADTVTITALVEVHTLGGAVMAGDPTLDETFGRLYLEQAISQQTPWDFLVELVNEWYEDPLDGPASGRIGSAPMVPAPTTTEPLVVESMNDRPVLPGQTIGSWSGKNVLVLQQNGFGPSIEAFTRLPGEPHWVLGIVALDSDGELVWSTSASNSVLSIGHSDGPKSFSALVPDSGRAAVLLYQPNGIRGVDPVIRVADIEDTTAVGVDTIVVDLGTSVDTLIANGPGSVRLVDSDTAMMISTSYLLPG